MPKGRSQVNRAEFKLAALGHPVSFSVDMRFVAVLLVMLLPVAALGRMGETMQQCEQRYGKAKEVARLMNGRATLHKYENEKLKITIIFFEGVAHSITYKEKDPLALDDIVHPLLRLNVPDKPRIGGGGCWWTRKQFKHGNPPFVSTFQLWETEKHTAEFDSTPSPDRLSYLKIESNQYKGMLGGNPEKPLPNLKAKGQKDLDEKLKGL